jgi:hypothetical protein
MSLPVSWTYWIKKGCCRNKGKEDGRKRGEPTYTSGHFMAFSFLFP